MAGLVRLLLLVGVALLAAVYRPKLLGDASLIWVETTGLSVNAKPTENPGVQPSVVGGQETDIQSFPWIVSIVSSQAPNAYTGHRCGGTVIDRDWILTSAHCIFNGETLASPSELQVLVGQADLSGNSGQIVAITDILPHPQFDTRTGDYDVGLMRLSRRLENSEPIPISFLDPQQLVETSASVTVVGWGSTTPSEDLASYPYILRKAELQLADSGQCQESLHLVTGEDWVITDRMLCAHSSTADACVGDSGGPLLYWDPEREAWIQIGVISWGISCAVPKLPGVYANLHSLASWIRAVTVSTSVQEPDTASQPASASVAASYYYPFVPHLVDP